MKAILSCWLRLLWDRDLSLRLDGETPRIVGGAIHLPPASRWTGHTAAAAHAAAHLVYSPPRFDGEGLGPIVRTVLALLEDARVEALAMRELPGLARLWRPLHTATPATGSGFEALLERLSRSLIDPGYDDPSPWVQKGRALFFLDVDMGLPALRTPAELRVAAMRLGHDVGQTRMQFNASSYLPSPAYRDDHRWMWGPDALEPAQAASTSADGRGGNGNGDDDQSPAELVARYPEWDRLISRLRPDWCCVSERPASGLVSPTIDAASRDVADRLRAPLQSLTRRATVLRRQDIGDVFDLRALVDWGLARRMRTASSGTVYLARRHRSTPALVWLLIDQSASTATPHGAERGTLLDAVVRAATATALALQQLGVTFAVAGFSSNGRHDVRMTLVKEFEPANDAGWIGPIGALRPGGSTRLGAALRHATRRLGQRHGASRLLLVLSDGQPHDVDVHDPRYLVEDARRAVHEAARTSVRTVCLVFAGDGAEDGSHGGADGNLHGGDAARHIFGPGGVQRIGELHDLPHAIARLFD